MTAAQPSLAGGDEHYLPSRSVVGWEGFYDQWVRNSQHARTRHEPRTLAYGHDPSEVIDLFEPRNSRGTVVFIHGGYWSELGRRDFSYVAPELLKDRWRVAVIDYALAPAVTLTHIVDQVRLATATLARSYDQPLVITGHSAGGHLAAMMHATDWSPLGVQPQILAGVGMSGLYELAPLLETSVQNDVRLTGPEVATLSPARLTPTTRAPFLVAVGELEPAAFQAQSAALTQAWPGVATEPRPLPGHNHFTICDELARLVHEVTAEV
ncbi:alpha/beta hydrolase [Mariniluteicoccus flavus]